MASKSSPEHAHIQFIDKLINPIGIRDLADCVINGRICDVIKKVYFTDRKGFVTSSRTRRTNPMDGRNVALHEQRVVIWKSMSCPSMERCHILVPNVTRPIGTEITWRLMIGPIHEGGHLLVPNVTTQFQKRSIWWSMRWPTQEGGHLLVPSVIRA